MRTIKVHYSVDTGYVGSTRSEDVEIEVPIDATENEIEDIIQPDFEDWVWNNINSGYSYESI